MITFHSLSSLLWLCFAIGVAVGVLIKTLIDDRTKTR